MNRSYLSVLALLAAVLSFSLVHAQAPPSITGVSTTVSLLGGLSTANSPMYAGFFAMVMFIIFAVALDRTQLSSGGIAISFIFALITFFILYTDNTLLHFFLNTFIVLAFIGLILGLLAAVKSPRSIRLIGLVIALFLVIVLFENDSGLTNAVNSTLHINILTILPLVFGIIAVIVFITLLLRGVKTHSNPVLRVILLFIVFLLIALLIPGFAGFLFSPIVLVPLFVGILLVLLLVRKAGRRGPKLSKQDRQDLKAAKQEVKPGVLSSWSQKRALKKQQKNNKNKNTFVSNTGNSQAGDLFDLANAANKGVIGSVPTDKAARKMFDRQISKEVRQKDVSALFNERNKILDPTLNLSESTRRKEVAKIDKKLKKISSKIVPKSPDQIKQNNLVKEQQEQRRQEMLEEQRLANAQLEAARRNAERERAERERLQEQAQLAEAAKQEEKNRKQQQEVAKAQSGVAGPNSAFDKRVKTPLWFSPKSPVDENGKLDAQMQNEIEARGLMDRRENLVNLLGSGKLSGKQAKDAKNELNRIDSRLKKYGREIHR